MDLVMHTSARMSGPEGLEGQRERKNHDSTGRESVIAWKNKARQATGKPERETRQSQRHMRKLDGAMVHNQATRCDTQPRKYCSAWASSPPLISDE